MYVCSICGRRLPSEISLCPQCRSFTGPFKLHPGVDLERARSTAGLNGFLTGVVGGFVLAVLTLFMIPEFSDITRSESAEHFIWYWGGWGVLVWAVTATVLKRV